MSRRTILLLGLVFCCAVGLPTPYLLGLLGLAWLLIFLLTGDLLAVYRQSLPARLNLLAFASLGVCFAITAQSPRDFASTVNFIMLVLFAPFFILMQRGARGGNTNRVAALALAGAAVSLLVCAVGSWWFHWPRSQTPLLGTIIIANTTMILGFLAVMGFRADRRGAIFAAGPVIGILVIAFSGSRGPLLAIAPLTVVAAWHLVSVGKLRVIPAAAMAVAYFLMAGTVVFWPDTRTSSLLPIIVESAPTIVGSSAVKALVVSEPADVPTPLPSVTEAVADPAASSPAPAPVTAPVPAFSESANIRLALWRGAWSAFQDSPIIGHGWARMMDVVEPYLAPDERSYAELPQLHNDIIDFAVAAGVIGVALYFLILFTPLVGAWRLPRDSQHAARTYGVVVLITAYACDGLTDLMFGFEFHTAFFVIISVILLGYCRDDPWSPAGRTHA